MPMDFPDLASLLQAAKVHKFRAPHKGESKDDYRIALAAHVAPRDFIESEEIRNTHGCDIFTEEEKKQLLRRRGFLL